LTGTPIQNRVEDFGALVSFLQVYPFDSPGQFHADFVSSIQRGNNTAIERLKALVQAISLRRTKESVFGELRLGPRVERVQSIELNEEERTLYTIVKKSWAYVGTNSGSVRSIFQTIMKLRQICNHGRELLSPETLAVLDQGYINGGRFEAIYGEPQSCENCGAKVQNPDSDEIANYLFSCLHLLCNQCIPRNEGGNTEEALCPVCLGSGISHSFSEDEQLTDPFPDPSQGAMDIDFLYRPSSKVLALLQNLRADRLASAKDPIKRYAHLLLQENYLLIMASALYLLPGPECWTWSKKHLRLRESSFKGSTEESLFNRGDRQLSLFVTTPPAQY
jgi:SNF2 family DNA or RNA helicase